jgi:hypothetical protein
VVVYGKRFRSRGVFLADRDGFDMREGKRPAHEVTFRPGTTEQRASGSSPSAASKPGRPGGQAASGRKKKSRLRKLLYWLLIDIAVAATVIGLLMYKPRRYDPVVSAGPANGRVHPYVSRDLGPQFYNGAQSQRPFDMVVLDRGLNEVISEAGWVQQSQGINLSRPAIQFVDERIVLMGTADVEGAEFVVTIELEPVLEEQGLLNLNVAKVKIGAMNITPLAKMVARKMYQQRLETEPVDTRDLRAQIAASLLNEEPFDPVFKAEDKWVRLTDFEITEGKLVARFEPAR